MKRTTTGVVAGLLSLPLLFGSVAGPAVMADGPTPSAVSLDIESTSFPADLAESWANIPTLEAPAQAEQVSAVNTLAQMNPLAPQQADAAWWHFTVRDWGTQCGYVWLGGKRYEVKRWAYGWTSDKPTCQRTGEVITVP